METSVEAREMRDMFGNVILSGDVISVPQRSGSSLWTMVYVYRGNGLFEPKRSSGGFQPHERKVRLGAGLRNAVNLTSIRWSGRLFEDLQS